MKKKIFFRSVLALVISYFMFVGVLYQNKASEARRLPQTQTPGCIQGIKNIRARANCNSRSVARGFRQANFECLGGGRGELHSRGCVSLESFREAAKESCFRMSNCRLSPTATPTPTASEPPPCQERPGCLDEDPACTIAEPEGGWCVVEPTETPSPTPCAMPTAPFCPGGQLIESDIPPAPGICPPTLLCAIPDTMSPSPTE